MHKEQLSSLFWLQMLGPDVQQELSQLTEMLILLTEYGIY